MSKIKNWLMEMQEYSQYLLEGATPEIAKEFFIKKYGESQAHVFDKELSFAISEGIEIYEGNPQIYDDAFFEEEDRLQAERNDR